MEFVQVGDDYINLATVQNLTITRDGTTVTSVTVRYLAGALTTRTYADKEAAALMTALEKVLARGHSRDYRAS